MSDTGEHADTAAVGVGQAPLGLITERVAAVWLSTTEDLVQALDDASDLLV
jgi:hypothetical protein